MGPQGKVHAEVSVFKGADGEFDRRLWKEIARAHRIIAGIPAENALRVGAWSGKELVVGDEYGPFFKRHRHRAWHAESGPDLPLKSSQHFL